MRDKSQKCLLFEDSGIFALRNLALKFSPWTLTSYDPKVLRHWESLISDRAWSNDI